jgi:DNA-binding LytR/AlgR family response regulator
MKIAICDNDAYSVELLNNIIIKFTKEYRGIEIYTYNSGEEIVFACKNKGIQFEIVFLDIKMGKMDGISAAKVISKLNSACLIFFVTAFMEYVFQGYEIRAFRYIMKPFSEDEIKKHFSKAILELRKDEKKYLIHTKSSIYTYYPDDILFLESSKRQVIANTVSGKVSFYSKLIIEEEKLKGFGFIRVHQGFLVNMAYIKTIIDNDMILTNGTVIPISKSKKKKTLSSYTRYLTEFDTI